MLSTILVNRSVEYFEHMKDQFNNLIIDDEKDFENARDMIINLYAETNFYNQRQKSNEFLYFQDFDIILTRLYEKGLNYKLCIVLVHESLTMLLEDYNYEIYCNELYIIK